jgi:beta-lactamase class C
VKILRKKFIYIFIFSLLGVFAFKLQAFVRAPEKEEVIEEVIKLPEYNPVVEIENTVIQFDSLLEDNLKQSGTVGAAAVVTYKGKVALIKCFGVRKAGENLPVNKNTVFRLASVSKSITGVLAGILHEEKIISLDDKVLDYLPELRLKQPEYAHELTIRHLLSHTSGLIPHAYDLMVEDHVPLEKIMERLDEVDNTAPPGKLYGYQNVVYSIYDPVTQVKTHRTFGDVLEEKVFIPFGMKDASTGFEAFKNNLNKAYPHYNRGHNRFSPMRLNDRYYNTAPAAGVNASIADLGKLLAALTDPNGSAIPENVKNTIFEPQVKTPLKRSYFRSWGREAQQKRYSIGWRLVNYKGREIAYHGGYVSGYKAEIAVCNQENIGIAILSNSPNTATAKNIPAFLNLLFDYKDTLANQTTTEKAEKTGKS